MEREEDEAKVAVDEAEVNRMTARAARHEEKIAADAAAAGFGLTSGGFHGVDVDQLDESAFL